MKRILSLFLMLVLTAALLSPAAAAANETAGKDSDWLYITLDPGHGGDGAGGNDPGAVNEKYGYQEADLVLKIGLYLKEELETYRNVHVDMTRSDRYGTSATAPLSKVENRVLYAAGKGSDLLVSLHLNSSASSSAQGATVLVSNGNYRPEIAKVLDGVAGNILVQLEKLGIQNRDLTKESSHDGTRYPNGKLADYYGIVRYGVENNVPSMIVEHCFLSSNSDCQNFLSSDAKLRAIAQADARGIAAYYGLEKKDPGEVDVEPLFRDFVDFETFSKSDFRVVKVKACEAVKKSKKLLKFVLDDGTGTDRVILSGIHDYYAPEELVGKTCIAITNLPPRPMMGIDSCGMLISAVHHEDGQEKLNLLMVDDRIPAGAKLY